ncbi:putative Major facilitator superfamily domain-containing protein [Seiridium cardinale]|uniref:Major facilitator superfamily domain-containing protein n=1 Tax=Seiridium cardinale TaxID=138064 RepID=A0ABR2X795_9PEZI
MPGRKRADRAAPIHRRARTGCKSCRTRKVKCDETKPMCRNCSSRGLACDSGLQLKWHEEFETRGIAFGRQGVWTKDSARRSPPKSPSRTVSTPSQWLSLPEIGPHHFLHTTLLDYGPHSTGPPYSDLVVEPEGCTISVSALQPSSPAAAQGSVILRQPSPVLPSIEFDSSLVEYYLRKLCPLTTSSRTTPSPFAKLILPLFTAPGQDDVLQSLMAFSARHRSIADPRWSHTAMSLKGCVLSSLQRRLATSDAAGLSVMFPQVLVTMMFLCLYEIVDKCDHRWVIHLRASQDIIRRSRALGVTQSESHTDSLAAFAERFFAFQDAVSRTACGDAPLFGVEYWDNLADKRQVDSWMGCSPELAGILCDITELGRAKAGGGIPTSDFFERADTLERRIHSLESTTQIPNDGELMSAAELKRLSASLYLHCVLYDANPATPIVSHLVQQILERIFRMLRAGHARALAFPVFVSAVELNPTDEVLVCDTTTGKSIHGRRLILETLDAMSTDSLSNVTRTRAVIQKVWRLRDMHVDEEAASQRLFAAAANRAIRYEATCLSGTISRSRGMNVDRGLIALHKSRSVAWTLADWFSPGPSLICDTPLFTTTRLTPAGPTLHGISPVGHEALRMSEIRSYGYKVTFSLKLNTMLFLVSLYACAFSFGENTLGAAWTTVSDETGVSLTNMNGGSALNYLLLGFVNIWWIPLANKLGRRLIFLLTTLINIAAMIWIGSFKGTGQWMASMVIMGIATSAYQAVIQLTIFDMFYVHDRGRMLSVYLFGQQLGSILGLISGGTIADTVGWRWSQYICAIIDGIVCLLLFASFEETLFPRFLFAGPVPEAIGTASSDVEKYSKGDGDEKPHLKSMPSNNHGFIDDFPKRTYLKMLKPWTCYPQNKTTYWQYFRRPFFLWSFPNIVIAGFIFAFGCTAGIVSFNTISEILTEAPYNFSTTATGLVFFAALIGSIVGWATGVLSDQVVIYLARRNGGVKEPEMRLWTLIPCFVYAAVGYMLYGWGAQTEIPWIGIAIGISAMIAHQVGACAIATAYAMECFPGISGELVVVLAMCSSMVNFAISYSVQPFVDAAGFGWSFFFFGMCVLVSMAMAIPLVIYGKSWRKTKASRYYQFLEEVGGSTD